MQTIDHTRMIGSAISVAHQLDQMAAQAHDDESLQAWFPILDQAAELAQELSQLIQHASVRLPGAAWIVPD